MQCVGGARVGCEVAGLATCMEQGLRAREEGLAKELENSIRQEVKLSETGGKMLFGTLTKAESAKALEQH